MGYFRLRQFVDSGFAARDDLVCTPAIMTTMTSADYERHRLNQWLGRTAWNAALIQACAGIVGIVMLGQSLLCGLQAHHGHAFLCSIGAMVNFLTYAIADAARREAIAATMLAHAGKPIDDDFGIVDPGLRRLNE